MPIEGELLVSLHCDGRRVRRVEVRSTRPAIGARVAIGRRPAEAAALLPALFAICGHAQGRAAIAAMRAAGAEPDETAGRAAWSVPLEAVQETFWRLLIDLPRALALASEAAVVSAARATVSRAIGALRAAPADAGSTLADAALALAALARDHVFGSDGDAWLADTDLDAFDRWRDAAATLPARALKRVAEGARSLGRSDTALMPGLEGALWQSVVLPTLQRDPAFAQAPTWGGRPVETGALARMRAQPLVAALVEREGRNATARIAARLVDLAEVLATLRRGVAEPERWVRAWSLDAGEGVAAVQTARGLLLHYARLDDGRVGAYRIVAPTDWNFHPEGALATSLRGAEADDEPALLAQARLAVLSLDPCVGYRVEVARDA